MTSTARTLSTDTLGIAFSSLCIVHCIATPLLVAASPLFARYLPGEQHTHAALAVFVALLGTLSIGTGFRKHRSALVVVLMASGFACIAAGAFFPQHLPIPEIAVTIAGSTLMIGAHRLNHTFCRDCRSCC